ncbi:MAG TPA: response regulator transcription factor [Candidatus Acidoferrum sp.]|jgi:two-component system KDP operon response regulator KdpE
MSSGKILVVDDAQQVRRVLRTALSAEGYTIYEAGTGEEALDVIRTSSPDAILLDVNMPGMGGLETCREIRRSLDVPIVMLTVRNSERDKVMALDAGADDYVVKPFGMQELLARIRAALRRRIPQGKETTFTTKDLTVDFEARLVTVRGRETHLTPKEFELLRHLVLNAGKPLTHRRLLQAVWGPDYGDEPEYLRVMINQLRKKIESDPARPKLILTEPWVGYRFQAPRESKHTKSEDAPHQ